MADFSDLLGKTLVKISPTSARDNEIIWQTSDGCKYRMYHFQNCCENVAIEDIVGDLQDLIGNPIITAEERYPDEPPVESDEESYTWTFYEIATIKGSVTIRWYGTSNGHYSESVDFEQIAA